MLEPVHGAPTVKVTAPQRTIVRRSLRSSTSGPQRVPVERCLPSLEPRSLEKTARG